MKAFPRNRTPSTKPSIQYYNLTGHDGKISTQLQTILDKLESFETWLGNIEEPFKLISNLEGAVSKALVSRGEFAKREDQHADDEAERG